MTDRFRDTTAIWNWLPAFRAVAETEHLPTAGEMLSVTPPALSRSVRNLEDAVGRELFVRAGRSLQLNDDGRALAAAVRTAMRTVHSALVELADETFHGPFRWASMWSMTRVVVDVLAKVVEEHPWLVPTMLPINPDDVVSPLLRGEVDLIVVTHRVDVEGVTATLLGHLSHSVFCGPQHPLAAQGSASWEELADHAFATSLADSNGVFHDGWPAERPRRVVFQFAQMEAGYQACHAGHVLAVLPDNVAAGLVRLQPIDTSPAVFALHRQTIVPGPAEAIAARLVEVL